MALEKELGGFKSELNFIPELFRGRQTQSMVRHVVQKIKHDIKIIFHSTNHYIHGMLL